MRYHFRWSPSPAHPDGVHGLADDADLSRRIPIRPAPHGDLLDLVKTLQMTMRTTQTVRCRRLAGPKKVSSKKKKKTQWHVPSTDVIAVTRKKSKKLTEKQKLTGSTLRTHEASALEASSSRNCRYVRPSPDPPDGARRQRLVCPGTGQAQRPRSFHFGMRVADS